MAQKKTVFVKQCNQKKSNSVTDENITKCIVLSTILYKHSTQAHRITSKPATHVPKVRNISYLLKIG